MGYRYYLSAIYKDNKTKLGTFGNTVFEGKSLKRKLANFKTYVKSIPNTIGIEIDCCINGYHSISVERIYF